MGVDSGHSGVVDDSGSRSRSNGGSRGGVDGGFSGVIVGDDGGSNSRSLISVVSAWYQIPVPDIWWITVLQADTACL